jgi:hypothetical protein
MKERYIYLASRKKRFLRLAKLCHHLIVFEIGCQAKASVVTQM